MVISGVRWLVGIPTLPTTITGHCVQGANARVVIFETPYMYNMLDGKQYPLLADGDYTWNDARTEITFKLKPAAKWSDGTPVTADDVAYTWATHLKYETTAGVGYQRLHRHRRSC